MLKQYGPDVPEAILQKLVAAFGELRSLADQGTINYPYSTREVVNIVKHLQVQYITFNWKLEFIDTNFLMPEGFRKNMPLLFMHFYLILVKHFTFWKKHNIKDAEIVRG